MIFLSPCRFQSTFPRGERHLCWLVAVKHIHFNPRSLVGNDYIPVGTYTIVEISIHVPSWGTTGFNRHGYVLFLYFNPRSLVGNDRSSNIQTHLHRDFNPRSLVGNDESDTSDMISSKISIHVPSWGTTDYRHTGSKDRKNFNPRSLVGNDDSATRQRPAI